MSVKTAVKLNEKIETLQADLRRTEAALEGANDEAAALPSRPGGERYEDLLAEAATGSDVKAELNALEADRERWDKNVQPNLERIESKRAGLLRRIDGLKMEVARLSDELPELQRRAVQEAAGPVAARYRRAVGDVKEALETLWALERAQPTSGVKTTPSFFQGLLGEVRLPDLSGCVGGGGGLMFHNLDLENGRAKKLLGDAGLSNLYT